MNYKFLPITVYYFIGFVVLVILVWWFEAYIEPPDSFNSSSFTYSFFTSFIGGLSLAAIFFVFLRPRVKISKVVSKRKNDDNKDYFTFKFVNRSFFSAFDVNIEAYLCENTNAKGNGDAKHVVHTPIELTRKRWIHMPRWRPVIEKTTYAPHCITVRTLDETIEKRITNNVDYIEFRVTLKHAFSNLSSTYRMKYMNEDCFELGKFDFGNTFKIV
ncbi:hypothetical protein PY092_06290 [Muricauda sp. 334s03]|uniref:Uncharacterized protein n=1 Tax=Flagellimonas yonaguniensis TaxID=3031325 RepID=A0ABT5XX39_9FLAO|nr:hypothetical protein [[Muricauda] yonaguniensis]MDF0715749.1 hypothetical protein [[Muricauda] yonaguniensis]